MLTLIKYLIPILILFSCKKEETKPTTQTPVVQYVFNYDGKNIVTKLIKKNSTEATPPFNVTKGDIIYVYFKGSTMVGTPPENKLSVSILLDGKSIGGCSGCNEYEKTFNIN